MSDYNEGYGQARADALQEIGEAFKLIHNELHFAQDPPTPKEERRALNNKLMALRWVRALIKNLTPPR